MRRPKVSLKTIFLIITVAAVTFAEIAAGYEMIGGLLSTVVILLVAMSPIAAYYRRNENRAFWLGVAGAGFGYAFLAKIVCVRAFMIDNRDWMAFGHQPLNLGVHLSNAWWVMFFALMGGLIAKYVIYRDPESETKE